MYDAWAAYDDRALGTELGARLRRPPWERTRERRREAVCRAAYLALLDHYPGESARFAAVLEQQGYAPIAEPRPGTPSLLARWSRRASTMLAGAAKSTPTMVMSTAPLT